MNPVDSKINNMDTTYSAIVSKFLPEYKSTKRKWKYFLDTPEAVKV